MADWQALQVLMPLCQHEWRLSHSVGWLAVNACARAWGGRDALHGVVVGMSYRRAGRAGGNISEGTSHTPVQVCAHAHTHTHMYAHFGACVRVPAHNIHTHTELHSCKLGQKAVMGGLTLAGALRCAQV